MPLQIRITARHVDATPTVHSYIEERLRKYEHFDTHVSEVHVILRGERFGHETELVALGKRVRLSSRVTAPHLLESFDMAFEKLKRQLKKHHERERMALRRRTAHRGLPR